MIMGGTGVGGGRLTETSVNFDIGQKEGDGRLPEHGLLPEEMRYIQKLIDFNINHTNKLIHTNL